MEKVLATKDSTGLVEALVKSIEVELTHRHPLSWTLCRLTMKLIALVLILIQELLWIEHGLWIFIFRSRSRSRSRIRVGLEGLVGKWNAVMPASLVTWEEHDIVERQVHA